MPRETKTRTPENNACKFNNPSSDAAELDPEQFKHVEPKQRRLTANGAHAVESNNCRNPTIAIYICAIGEFL